MPYVDAVVGLRARILAGLTEWADRPLGVSTRADGPRPHVHLDPVPAGLKPFEPVVDEQVKLNAYPGVDLDEDEALEMLAAVIERVEIPSVWSAPGWSAGGLYAIRCRVVTRPHLVPDLSPREPRALAAVELRYRPVQQTP